MARHSKRPCIIVNGRWQLKEHTGTADTADGGNSVHLPFNLSLLPPLPQLSLGEGEDGLPTSSLIALEKTRYHIYSRLAC
jgi:hypothetical protein